MKFWTKPHPAFGERTYWECACGERGSDDPALKVSAEQTAQVHIDRARTHYTEFRLEDARENRRDELLKVMREELSIFAGRISVDDCAVITAQIGNDHYRYAMRERDQQIAVLLNERNALRRQVAELTKGVGK